MKNLFYLAFIALFGTYGLGVLNSDAATPKPEMPKLAAATPASQTTPTLPEGHYVLKAMR